MVVPERSERNEAAKMSDKDWLWSIKPLVTWLKWLGVNLSNRNQSNSCRYFTLYSIFVLLLSIVCQVLCLDYVVKNHKELSNTLVTENGLNSDAFAWNTVLDFANFAAHGLGCHIVLVSFFSGRWNLLVEAFQDLEPYLSEDFFVGIRRASVMGVCWIIIMQATLCFIIGSYHINNGSPFLVLCCVVVSALSQVHPITAVLLFVVVSYASSNAYQTILWDLAALKNQPMNKQHYDRLTSLKRYHVLVCETIDHINNCFGWILGISLLFHFVSIVTTSFYLFGNERERGTLLEYMELSFFISQILHVLLICYPPDLIQEKADAVMKELTQMKIEMREPHKSLASAFALQADNFFPEVTAVGFYPIGRKIIPQIMGTTLTYFIILYQFHSSEKQ
ncbi:hypothetical protein GHT06_010308 [Daphnia sinensis]|uniref:Gustatory receptor n=1 Tax=Daphnia sinensis TaxID=1820382 RepID=A0AAD5LIC7_9CRUS|nr:hypothetical protein GHT06_010308 [Daphnia sinensis]